MSHRSKAATFHGDAVLPRVCAAGVTGHRSGADTLHSEAILPWVCATGSCFTVIHDIGWNILHYCHTDYCHCSKENSNQCQESHESSNASTQALLFSPGAGHVWSGVACGSLSVLGSPHVSREWFANQDIMSYYYCCKIHALRVLPAGMPKNDRRIQGSS